MGFFDVLIKPEEVFKSEIKNASFGKAILPYVIMGLVAGILLGGLLFAAGIFLLPFLKSSYDFTVPAAMTGLFGGTGLVFGILFGVIGYPLMVLIGTGFLFLIAKLFGGKGTFTELLYLSSLLVWPLLAIGILVSIAASILMAVFPPLGMLLHLAFAIYGAYLGIAALKVAMGLEWLHSILVFVVLWVICAIIAGIIALVVVLSMASFFGGLGNMMRV
jgi:hypothetical protein